MDTSDGMVNAEIAEVTISEIAIVDFIFSWEDTDMRKYESKY